MSIRPAGILPVPSTSQQRFTVESSKPYPHGSKYKEDSIIGNGAYGTVYKAYDVHNPSIAVALKKVRIPLSQDGIGIPVSIIREISLVRQVEKFHHPNIIKFLDVCRETCDENEDKIDTLPHVVLYLVFEFVDMDLSKYIQIADGITLSQLKIKEITYQILNGVDFLHSQRIIHRDLKPQNILITCGGHVKLADFGLAKIYDFSSRLTTVVATIWYRSPEVLLGCSYSSSIDLWSVGCILAELFRRRPFFPGSSEKNQLDKIFDIMGTPSESDWPSETRVSQRTFPPRPAKLLDIVVPGLELSSKDLLIKLLIFNPDNRINARDAMIHPYFKQAEISPQTTTPGKLDTTPLLEEASSSSLAPPPPPPPDSTNTGNINNNNNNNGTTGTAPIVNNNNNL